MIHFPRPKGNLRENCIFTGHSSLFASATEGFSCPFRDLLLTRMSTALSPLLPFSI